MSRVFSIDWTLTVDECEQLATGTVPPVVQHAAALALAQHRRALARSAPAIPPAGVERGTAPACTTATSASGPGVEPGEPAADTDGQPAKPAPARGCGRAAAAVPPPPG